MSDEIPAAVLKEILSDVERYDKKKKGSGRVLRWKYRNNVGVGVFLAKRKGLSEKEYVKLVQEGTKKGLRIGKILLGSL